MDGVETTPGEFSGFRDLNFWLLASEETMNNSHSPDRRKFPRFHISIPITFLFPEVKVEEPLHATSVNISLNGIYCTVNQYIPMFRKILVTLLNPAHNGKPNQIVLQSEGVVVRIEPEQREAGRAEYYLALFFPNLSQQQQDALQTLLDSHVEIL